jgi:hypothetical protein
MPDYQETGISIEFGGKFFPLMVLGSVTEVFRPDYQVSYYQLWLEY